MFSTWEALRNVPRLLEIGRRLIRDEVYRSLGITLTYRRERDGEYVRVQAKIDGVDLELSEGGLEQPPMACRNGRQRQGGAPSGC